MSDVIYNISSGFFDSVNGDRLYSAGDMNKPYKRVIADGIFPTPQGTPSTDFQVVAVSGMSVAVLAGNAMIGARWAENTDDVGITIAGNSSSSPRIDSIFLHIDTGMDTRAAGVVYRQGTAAGTPTAPAMVQTDNITELRLADILVAPSAAIITQANITDQRGGSDCPWVAGLIQQVDTSALFDQYRAAYAEQQQDQAAEWNTFMDHLARDYDISMSLRKHESTYTSTAAASMIPINIDGYDTTKDLLQVYINGIFAVEGTHYIVKSATQIQLTNAISAGQKVHFVIYKAVMGGAQPIIPTDEQVQDAVDAYMDAHPGALVVDPELSDTSTHAIQNKAVTEALAGVNGRLDEQGADILELQEGGYVADQQQIGQKINAWLNDHPEATTTVQDGSLTSKKFGTILSGEVKTLSSFDGATDELRLYDALITKAFKGTILCGNITINSPISIPSVHIREVKLANAIITLNSDMFTAQSDGFARLPSFMNCKFIGNGNSIYSSNYAVFGSFVDCSFEDCALMNNDSGIVQSAYLAHCEVLNNNVSLIKANSLYDCRLDGLLCERQNATLIDTRNSTGGTGGARTLWVENSTFEGFRSTVFDLAGGGPRVYIHNCYFEANANSCLKLKKSNDGYDYLTLEICGCRVNSEVTPFEISGFTNNYRVKVSIHDNCYYTSVTGTPMISGVPVDNAFAIYNNTPSYQTDVISDTARFPYDASAATFPTTGDSSKFSIRAGGITQIGRLVFLSGVIRVETAITSTISDALTGLPRSSINAFRIPLYNADAEGIATDKYLYLNGTSASFRGGSEANVRYYFNAMYFTDNKIVM